MARTTSSDTPPETPPEEEEPQPEPTEQQRQMNEAMAAQQAKDKADAAVANYPPGADEVTADNVRHYPDLFTDEQKASFSTEELPETETEKAQREQAEEQEAS